MLISTTEAAGQLGVDTAKVRRWIERGHLESFRIAGRRRYFVDQLEVDALKVISESNDEPELLSPWLLQGGME